MIIGLVGKPSCGKSTFFKAATLAEVDIAPYPFTTIEKNEGVGFVKVDCVDKEFNVQCNPRFGYCVDHKRFVPVQLIDVAGLVPEAHLGKGRGNQFLEDLREADVLIHIVDVSGSINAQGEQVETGSYNPANDILFLEVELDMWYLGILKKGWEKFARQIQQEHRDVEKSLAKQLSAFKVTEDMVKEVIKELNLDKGNVTLWSEVQLKSLAVKLRKLTKPMIIAANKIDVPGAKEKYEKLKQEFRDYIIIPCSAESEVALKEAAKHKLIEYIPGENDFKVTDESKLNDSQKKALDFVKNKILGVFGTTGVQDVLNSAVFGLLGYIAIFPGGINKLADKDGNILPDCFLLPRDSTALDFAYRIHTDIGDKFIRAMDVKKRMVVGREHLLKHKDVVEIITAK